MLAGFHGYDLFDFSAVRKKVADPLYQTLSKQEVEKLVFLCWVSELL